MISKKLLGEILNKEIINIEKIPTENNLAFGYKTDSKLKVLEINIYELAYKCKEWALDKGYVCHSVRNLVGYTVYFSGDCREPSGYYKEDTEPEAIFKACQWILEQKD